MEYDDAFRGRSARLEKERAARKAGGAGLRPVVPVARRDLSTTFWGREWNRHLMAYCEQESAMPRGRTLFRKGAVMDLEVEPGFLTALVEDVRIWDVRVNVRPLPGEQSEELASACAWRIGSLVELLSGDVSEEVMGIMARPGAGLFPLRSDVKGVCSCTDTSGFCRHVAAVLYAFGCLLDEMPRHLFRWRGVDPADLVRDAPAALAQALTEPGEGDHVLPDDDLGGLFGITLEGGASS